jgi:S1-C subfamily serine protease
VLHFFTGQHSDYHKPSDDWEKINFKGEEKVLEYIIKVIEETESLPKMKFLTTKNTEEGKSSFKVTLGIMPDYTFEGKGLRVDGVTKGKPADAAGLLQGDLIIQLGEIKINDINDYMKALSKFNKGESTGVIISRAGKEMKMKVTF